MLGWGLVVGCTNPTSEGSDASSPSGTTTASTSVESSGSESSGTSTGAGTSGSTATPTDESTTAVDTSTSGNETMPSTTTGQPQPDKPCSLEAVDPSADPEAAIDDGDGVGQIPTVIAEVLLRNCGCHYNVGMLPPGYVDYISDDQPMSTHADFHQLFTGTFPQEYEGMPAYLAVQQRVVEENPLPMPALGCTVDDEPGHRITDADREVLADWLAAGAPDGASYPAR